MELHKLHARQPGPDLHAERNAITPSPSGIRGPLVESASTARCKERYPCRDGQHISRRHPDPCTCDLNRAASRVRGG
jgi:hypothetical protein